MAIVDLFRSPFCATTLGTGYYYPSYRSVRDVIKPTLSKIWPRMTASARLPLNSPRTNSRLSQPPAQAGRLHGHYTSMLKLLHRLETRTYRGVVQHGVNRRHADAAQPVHCVSEAETALL